MSDERARLREMRNTRRLLQLERARAERLERALDEHISDTLTKLSAERARAERAEAELFAARTRFGDARAERLEAALRSIYQYTDDTLSLRDDDGPHDYGWQRTAVIEARNRAGAALADPAPAHPDDIAVDQFAVAMKAKLAKQRAKGYRGWDDAAQCTVEWLAELLRSHVDKGDPVDVGNFAMMLWHRGGSTALAEPVPGEQEVKP